MFFKKPNKPENQNNFIKFSGIGFEMLAFILLGYWLGGLLDEYFGKESAIFTIVGILLGIAGSMVNLMRKFPNE